MGWPSFSLPNIAKNSRLIKKSPSAKTHKSGSSTLGHLRHKQVHQLQNYVAECIFLTAKKMPIKKFIPQFCSMSKGENFRRWNKKGCRSGEHWAWCEHQPELRGKLSFLICKWTTWTKSTEGDTRSPINGKQTRSHLGGLPWWPSG